MFFSQSNLPFIVVERKRLVSTAATNQQSSKWFRGDAINKAALIEARRVVTVADPRSGGNK